MIRVLHAGYQRYWAPGVVRQLEQEQQAANDLKLDWHSRLFLPSDIGSSSEVVVKGSSRSSKRAGSKRDYYRWLSEACGAYDVILLRHMIADLGQPLFLRKANKPVFLVHHSKEGPEIFGEGGLRSKIKWALEGVTGPISIRNSSGTISVTGEIAAYERQRSGSELPSLIYPNGFSFDDLPILPRLATSGTPEIAFVASCFSSWHGLDRLIDAAKGSNDDFIIHVIGEADGEDRQSASKDGRFIFHGLLGRAEMDNVLRSCILGLSSFALDRKGVEEACTLKVREYLARGIPVYSGHRDVFQKEFLYYQHGPCSMKAIMEMANAALHWKREDVREAAKIYIDKSRLLEKLYGNIVQLVAR